MADITTSVPAALTRSGRVRVNLRKDFIRNKYIYLMALPVVVFYVLFHYIPMYGAIISFKQFSPAQGIMGSPWVGFQHFTDFFQSFYFWRVLRNTVVISLSNLVWGFPAPIILALLLNEVRSSTFKRTVQSLTYIPYFISVVVIAGMIIDFTQTRGVINDVVASFGGQRVNMLQRPGHFVPLYVISEIWQQVGWGTIIYLAALTSIDPGLYEAATIDGANRVHKLWHITLPSIAPTIIILLILRMGNLMTVGYEKIILLYNPGIYETADVISTFVYRRGLIDLAWSYSTAVGLFNSVANFTFLLTANWISTRMKQTSLF
ncbi:MAG: sugar ABC transporter permease [Spirochaetaceae bacterium]|nr:MAG: sugar ABC transporter permease [Spirochaetaceae bacterium]